MDGLENPLDVIGGATSFMQQEWVMLAQVFIIVLATLFAAYVQRRVTQRLKDRSDRRDKAWERALLETARRPVSLIIWLIGLSFAAGVVGESTGAPVYTFIEPVRAIGIIAALAWWFTGFAHRFEKLYIEARDRDGEGSVDRTGIEALGKLVRAAIIITAALVGLQNLGVNLAGLVTFGGVGGIIIGFAAKDLLANFFGGLMVYMDRPFEPGNWVRSPDREIEGTVEEIGWRLTRIRTFEQRPLYVPNAVFSSVSLENPSRMTHRRINETVGVRYADAPKVRRIVEAIREMIETNPDLDTGQTTIVRLNHFGDFSMDIMVYCFTRTINWIEYHRVKEDVLLRINDLIEAHGAEIAFPTRTVHLSGEENASPPGGPERAALQGGA